MRRKRLLVAALACTLALALPAAAQTIRAAADAAAAQAAQGPRDRLPDGASVAVFYNGDQPDMAKTALAEIWNEPDMKGFFEPAWEAIRKALRENVKPPSAPDLAALEPVLRARVAFAVYPPAPGGKPVLLVVVSAGAEGSPVRAAIQKAFQGVEGTPIKIGDVDAVKVQEAVHCFAGQDFLIGTQQAVEQALDAQTARLTASDEYKELARQTGLGNEVLGCVVDCRKLLSGPLAPDQEVLRVLRVLGLDQAKALAATWAPSGRGMMTTLYVDMPTDRGLIAALTAKPMDPAMLKMAPRDSLAMFAGSANPVRLYDAILAAVGEVAGPDSLEQLKAEIARAENRTGVNLRDQFLATLDEGTMLTVQEGGLLVPNLAVVQKVKDAAAADAALAKLLAVAAGKADALLNSIIPGGRPPADQPPQPGQPPQPDQPAAVQSTVYNGVTLHYVPMALIAPTYAIARGYLVVTLSPVEMKDFLDSLSRGSLAENEDWTFVRGQLPMAVPQGLYYGEFKAGARKYYYLLPTAAAVVTSLDVTQVKLDLGKLQGADRVVAHLFGAAATWQLTPSGLKTQCFSPTGTQAPTTWQLFAWTPPIFLTNFLTGYNRARQIQQGAPADATE